MKKLIEKKEPINTFTIDEVKLNGFYGMENIFGKFILILYCNHYDWLADENNVLTNFNYITPQKAILNSHYDNVFEFENAAEMYKWFAS